MPSLTPYQQTIHLLKYARWLPKEGRRETFDETCTRFHHYMLSLHPTIPSTIDKITNAIRDRKLAPSMRLFATAGAAVDQDNLMAYNCMFMTMDDLNKLPKLMYALMCGTGVGFSVEQRYIDRLTEEWRPKVPETSSAVGDIVVPDNRLGWSQSFHSLIIHLMMGIIPGIDYSLVRPKGSPLKTTGGYASGPEPLKLLFDYTIEAFKRFGSVGYVRPIDIYDLCCRIADVVVQGGVRRSACIAIFSPEDGLMWESKQDCGDKPWRFNANNSVMFETEADAKSSLPMILQRTRTSGEPGILIRSVLKRQMEACGREPEDDIGVNPCGEIILRDMQVCNLTEVVVRPEYSVEELEELVELAVIQGMLQSTMTRTILTEVRQNCEHEPLLGVSLTGLADDPVLMQGNCECLSYLRSRAHEVATKWAEVLRMRQIPKAITTVKPSGTVSKLAGCAPGIHPWYATAYLNNISIPVENPLVHVLKDAGIPVRHTDERSVVFSFPVFAPEGSQVSTPAITQLDNWRKLRKHWADHNVSCTIYVDEGEWPTVEAWLAKHIGILSGLTFTQRFYNLDHCAYMPLEVVTTSEALSALVTVGIPWEELLKKYDRESTITSSREVSCAGGNCLL